LTPRCARRFPHFRGAHFSDRDAISGLIFWFDKGFSLTAAHNSFDNFSYSGAQHQRICLIFAPYQRRFSSSIAAGRQHFATTYPHLWISLWKTFHCHDENFFGTRI
jgi:hypothetical protein